MVDSAIRKHKIGGIVSKLKKSNIAKAFWISPMGLTLEVPGKHIETVIEIPNRFGITKQLIQDTYKKYGEVMGEESNARDELLSFLIQKKGWIRVRINKQNCVCCQIGANSKKKRYARNIWNIFKYLHENLTRQEFRGLSLKVYVQADCNIINEFDMDGARKQLLKEMTR